MRKAAGLALCALAASLAISVEPASACTCALGDPRAALARADAALVGVFVEKRLPPRITSSGDLATYTFRVEEAVKGELGETVDVRSAVSGASCGLEVEEGERVGLLLDRRGDAWTSGLCSQLPPEKLRAAARPLPGPDGSGPVAFLVGGGFGEARTIALDARARTLRYGYGRGEASQVSVCPGSRRAVEVFGVGGRFRLAARELPSLRVVRERALPLTWNRSPHLGPASLSCRSPSGDDVLLFATNHGGANGTAQSRILRIGRNRVSVVHRGTAMNCAFGRARAYLAQGRDASQLAAVELRTGAERALGRLPTATGALAVSPDGRTLAGLAYGAPIPGAAVRSRVVLVDLRTGKVRTASLGRSNVSGTMVWLGSQRVAFLPGGGDRSEARVYDASLRVRGRFDGWDGQDAVVVHGVAFGVGFGGRVLAARLPNGPVRLVRELPTPVANALAAVPRARSRAPARPRRASGRARDVALAAPAVVALVAGAAFFATRRRARSRG